MHLPVSELKEYAVGLRGKEEKVNRFTCSAEILRRERFGRDSIYVVTRYNFNKTTLQKARKQA